ncbi:MAG: S-layer homology domain-containing protein, partial [Selenomonadaceae bacterium]
SVQFNYKGATAANPGSFGVYAAYRYLGATATIAPTWDGVSIGQKGYEIGTTYTFDKNIVGTLIYFDGKDIDAVNNTDKDASKFFANVDFFF